MKVLIVSDTHGQSEKLRNVYSFYEKKMDLFIHCGDSEQHAEEAEMKPFYSVKGNCDGADAGYKDNELINQSGLTWLITHGHLYNVKSTPLPLKFKAEETDADIVCFGHTHHAAAFKEGKTVYINPGSIGVPKSPAVPTYSIAEWIPSARRLTIRLMTLEHQELEDYRVVYILENKS